MRRLRLSDFLLAIFGGLTIPWFAMVLVSIFYSFFPEYQNVMDDVGLDISQVSPLIVFPLIAILIPFLEEILFRGLLWRMVDWILSLAGIGTIFTAVIVTVVFAFAHGDPGHVVGVFPSAIWMGWMRYRSGSIIPSFVTHVVNNSVALTIMYTMV